MAEALLLFLEALAEPVVPFAFYSKCLDSCSNFTLCKQVLIAFLSARAWTRFDVKTWSDLWDDLTHKFCQVEQMFVLPNARCFPMYCIDETSSALYRCCHKFQWLTGTCSNTCALSCENCSNIPAKNPWTSKY